MTLDSWSADAVAFTVPETITGVPFGTEGTLRLTLPDGEGSQRVVDVEPRTDSHFSRDTVSRSGGPALTRFEENHEFLSAALPTSYRKGDVNSDFVHRDCVEFEVSNALMEPVFGIGADGPVAVTPLSDAYETGGKLVMNVNLKDDRLWNFSVTAEFFIWVPRGIPTPPYGVEWSDQPPYGNSIVPTSLIRKSTLDQSSTSRMT